MSRGQSWTRCKRSRVAGFTLIEALIATVLMVAILAALATITAQWLPNWNRGLARVQRMELNGIGLERIVADLAAAQFIPSHSEAKGPLFDGTELSVTFVRSALGPNARQGLEIVQIGETADARGLAVVRATAPFAPVAPGSFILPQFANPVVLMRAPYRISFAYAGADRAWHKGWHDLPNLPRAVRVQVRDGRNEQILALSTATMVHVNVAAECASANNPLTCADAKPDAAQKP
jgi:general secretion pathway protein J